MVTLGTAIRSCRQAVAAALEALAKDTAGGGKDELETTLCYFRQACSMRRFCIWGGRHYAHLARPGGGVEEAIMDKKKKIPKIKWIEPEM